MTETPLDIAHARMVAAPDDTAARLAFYDRLAEAELHVLLAAEVIGDTPIAPRIFDLDSGALVAAFDLEERLAAFAGGPAPHATLSGRGLAAELARGGLGLALNLGAPSEIVLPAEALTWLTETLASGPAEVEARPETFGPPGALPEALLSALDAKLATAAGLARAAYVAGVTYDGGSRAHLLAFTDPLPGAEPALARAVAEALTFSGLEAGALDVTFLAADSAAAQTLDRVALRIDLPQREAPPTPGANPGMDSSRPPRLK